VKEEPKVEAIGAAFQEETKYNPEKLAGYALDWSKQPAPFKNYKNPIERVALPNPEIAGAPSIWTALQKRRSRRAYRVEGRLAIGLLSTLLWATQGATAKWGDLILRTAPSAGGLFPVETYIYARAVEKLEEGFYHFRPQAFDLECVEKGDFSGRLAHAALDQAIAAEAQVTFIWSAVIARGRWKYRQRVYRYIYLDAGHIAQNLYLAAEALGLGVCAIGAFYDDLVNGLVGLDGKEETVIYMASVGLPAEENS
jgi:SagB-type dehydrogenase family enzyme